MARRSDNAKSAYGVLAQRTLDAPEDMNPTIEYLLSTLCLAASFLER